MSAAFALGSADAVRVMVVDNSIVARSLTSRWLQEQPDFEVVAACRSGREAVERVGRARPDVVVLDVEMPVMDGVEALPLLLRARPGLAVLMASSYTTRGADLSVRCLALGATDILAKPSRDDGHGDDFRRNLVEKVRALGDLAKRRAASASRVAAGAATLARLAGSAAARRIDTRAAAAAPAQRRICALAIGASTGGPQALSEVLRSIAPSVRQIPVFVVQHMPAGFTAALAEHLALASGLPVREAEDGKPLRAGTVHVAPGGRHFSVDKAGSELVAKVEDGPPIHFCKPSVDPLFRSASAIYGSSLLAAVLTGMGSDGAAAVTEIAARGGCVIAQDEASSVVWGMPGAAVATGACSAVLPLKEIGPQIVQMLASAQP